MFGLLKKTKAPAVKKSKPVDPEFIEIDGYDFRIRVTTNKRARRYILKQDLKNGGFILTRPPRSTFKAAERFAHDHIPWMIKHHTTGRSLKKFEDGDRFYFYDTPLTIENNPHRLRGLPQITDTNGLLVPGHPDNMHRKICDFLKADFRENVSRLAHRKAAIIDKTIRRIRIADQKTRWGSCSTTGTLSFSCRLVFAPQYVVDYVVAHEVAHMIHMDHSSDFWDLCDELCDHDQMHQAKHWLKTNDQIFMKYHLS